MPAEGEKDLPENTAAEDKEKQHRVVSTAVSAGVQASAVAAAVVAGGVEYAVAQAVSAVKGATPDVPDVPSPNVHVPDIPKPPEHIYVTVNPGHGYPPFEMDILHPSLPPGYPPLPPGYQLQLPPGYQLPPGVTIPTNIPPAPSLPGNLDVPGGGTHVVNPGVPGGTHLVTPEIPGAGTVPGANLVPSGQQITLPGSAAVPVAGGSPMTLPDGTHLPSQLPHSGPSAHVLSASGQGPASSGPAQPEAKSTTAVDAPSVSAPSSPIKPIIPDVIPHANLAAAGVGGGVVLALGTAIVEAYKTGNMLESIASGELLARAIAEVDYGAIRPKEAGQAVEAGQTEKFTEAELTKHVVAQLKKTISRSIAIAGATSTVATSAAILSVAEMAGPLGTVLDIAAGAAAALGTATTAISIARNRSKVEAAVKEGMESEAVQKVLAEKVAVLERQRCDPSMERGDVNALARGQAEKSSEQSATTTATQAITVANLTMRGGTSIAMAAAGAGAGIAVATAASVVGPVLLAASAAVSGISNYRERAKQFKEDPATGISHYIASSIDRKPYLSGMAGATEFDKYIVRNREVLVEELQLEGKKGKEISVGKIKEAFKDPQHLPVLSRHRQIALQQYFATEFNKYVTEDIDKPLKTFGDTAFEQYIKEHKGTLAEALRLSESASPRTIKKALEKDENAALLIETRLAAFKDKFSDKFEEYQQSPQETFDGFLRDSIAQHVKQDVRFSGVSNTTKITAGVACTAAFFPPAAPIIIPVAVGVQFIGTAVTFEVTRKEVSTIGENVDRVMEQVRGGEQTPALAQLRSMIDMVSGTPEAPAPKAVQAAEAKEDKEAKRMAAALEQFKNPEAKGPDAKATEVKFEDNPVFAAIVGPSISRVDVESKAVQQMGVAGAIRGLPGQAAGFPA